MKTLSKVSLIVLLIANFSYSQDAWEKQNSGTTEYLNDVYFIDENNGWVVGTNGTILNTVDGGETWTKQESEVTSELRSVQFLNESKGWIVGDETIMYTINSGMTWETYSNELMDNPKFFYFLDQMHGWIGGHGDYILKTDDGGCNWEAIKFEEKELNGVFFINDKIGWFFDIFRIYKTEDGGYTILDGYESTFCNSVFFLNSNLGWTCRGWRSMTMGGGCMGDLNITRDGGAHWTTQIENMCLKSIIFFDEQNGITLGMIGGGLNIGTVLLKTTNGGETWESQSLGRVGMVDFHFCNMNTGWIVGYDGLIMKTTTGGFSNIPIEENIGIKEFKLSQNYPNPFNPLTTIEFNLPKTEFVELKVYSILGKEVWTLVSKKLNEGKHTFTFDGRNLPSGIYFYRIQAGDFQDMRKMILLR